MTLTDSNRLLASTMSEADLLANVLDAAKALGWLAVHFRPALTSKGWRTAVSGDGKGWPDLVLVSARRGRIIYVELKAERGRPTLEQQMWLKELVEAGAEVFIWKPQHWLDNSILEVLR